MRLRLGMPLIHDSHFFTSDSILERSKKYDFPNPVTVEMFIWDCEIAAQLQNADARMILKGGAAAQLLLPPEKQRGSVDIDMLATGAFSEGDVSDLILKVTRTVPSLKFSPYEPMEPNPRLPLVTYIADMPSALQGLMRRKNLEIKADILLADPGLPTTEISNVETFALEVLRMKIPTRGSCIGDKLLTLAKDSIGMTLEEDYPKQMYDIDLLSEEMSTSVFADIVDAIRKLTPLEASYRGLDTKPAEAIRDVLKVTARYATLDTSIASPDDKKRVEAFQQFFVSQSQRLPLFGWASRALRIRFMTRLVGMTLDGRMGAKQVVGNLAKARDLAESLNSIQGTKIDEVRSGLLKMITEKPAYFRQLKGKHLSRVFWEAATTDNLDKVESLFA